MKNKVKGLFYSAKGKKLFEREIPVPEFGTHVIVPKQGKSKVYNEYYIPERYYYSKVTKNSYEMRFVELVRVRK